ncbi:hypothetical protein J7K93_13580 [bacterium]|nr:hypothetical protein [bacterium]
MQKYKSKNNTAGSVSDIIHIGGFTALGVALGFALFNIPNIELVSATIFTGGFLLGKQKGIIIGLLTESIYSLFNPFGIAAPPLFIAQIISMALIGFTGGLISDINLKSWKFPIVLAAAGGILTSVFALLTTLSFVFLIGLDRSGRIAAIISGIGFNLLHIISNTLIFSTIVPAIITASSKTSVFKSKKGALPI